MTDKAKDFQKTVETSNKILLFFPEVINSDIAASIGLTHKLLKDKMGRDVEVASSRDIPVRFHRILSDCGIDLNRIIKHIKPVSYIIKINDAKDNIKVDWEKKSDAIEVKLVPENQEIDFTKVSFAKEGGYDLFITFNSIRLEDLGNIYENSKSQFSKTNITSIDIQSSNSSYGTLSLHDENYSTISEIVYKLYKELGYEFTLDEAEIITEGIIGSTYGLHTIQKSKTYETISELANTYRVSILSVTNKYFYSLSKQELKLRERLLRNVKFYDSKRIIYSTLNQNDFNETGAKATDLDGTDYLPFNVCKDYDYAFLAYESNEKTTVLIHSNKSSNSILDVLKKVKGFGNKTFGIIYSNDNIDITVNRIINNIGVDSDKPKSPSPLESEPKSSSKTEEVKTSQGQVQEKVKAEVKQDEKAYSNTNTEITKPVNVVNTDSQQPSIPATKVENKTTQETNDTSYNSNTTQQPLKTPQNMGQNPIVQQTPSTKSPFSKAESFEIDQNAKSMNPITNNTPVTGYKPFQKSV